MASPLSAANRYDPRLRFRTLSTPHFDIHFHQNEGAEALRLAAIVEQVADALVASLGRPDARVHVILVDQSDVSNGWATPVPFNTIEITAAAPPGDTVIGNTDDWLRLVFTHEYTHIVHLSRRRGWIGSLHSVFGRLPIVYPNLFLPTWQVEGIAVYEESARTGMGRLPAGDFRQLVERAAARGRLEPLDRVNGGLIDWPSGGAAYAYGGYFQNYLAHHYGEASLRRLADETSRRIPFLGTRAYKTVFGKSLGELWAEFERSLATDASNEHNAALRITRQGFRVEAPRFGPGDRIYYSSDNPHEFPALMKMSPDGSRSERVTTRFLGNRTGVGHDVLVFDQLELVRSVALQSDLYAVHADGGPAWRLTREARAEDPDLSPDGATIVCVVQRADRRELATLPFSVSPGRLAVPAPLVSEAGTDYAAPRWSPDGRLIAAERRRAGVRSEIVLVDPQTRRVRVVSGSGNHRSVTPAWAPDGSHLLFASDRDGGPFRIFRLDLAGGPLERLEGTGPGGALSPDVSPDGKTLVFGGYTTDGQDLFTIDLRSAKWTRGKPDSDGAPADDTLPSRVDPNRVGTTTGRPYAPWRTLVPTFWTPLAETDGDELLVGAATGASDALGRQAYAADAAWAASRTRPDWHVAYAYDRWQPTIFADYSDDTDPFRAGEARTRELEAGLVLPFRRVRRSQRVLAAFDASTDTIDCRSCVPAVAVRAVRRAARAGWNFDTSKSFGYSISPEEGVRVTTTAELIARALGTDANAGSATIDARLYRALFPRHGVIAVRAGAATAWGDDRVRRVFGASGAGPVSSGFDFATDAIALLRGFAEDFVVGRHAVAGNLDYRIPIAHPQRGFGTVPLFVRAFHAAVFGDVGHAWDGAFHAGDVRASAGAELSLDTVVGYGLPLTFTGGGAWRHDPSGRARGFAVFGRIGRAF